MVFFSVMRQNWLRAVIAWEKSISRHVWLFGPKLAQLLVNHTNYEAIIITNVFDAHSSRATAKVKLIIIIIHCDRMNTTASSTSSSPSSSLLATAKQVFFRRKQNLFQTKNKNKWKRKQFWMKPVLPAAITTTSPVPHIARPFPFRCEREKCVYVCIFIYGHILKRLRWRWEFGEDEKWKAALEWRWCSINGWANGIN